jgi:hypothetical protein
MNKKIEIDPAEQLPPANESHRPERPDAAVPPTPGQQAMAAAPHEPAPAPRPDQPSPAAPDVRAEEFFPPERRQQLRGTWVDIQSAFIDEPKRAVQNADGLVKEILGAVSQKFESARHSLETEWNRGEQASTESLRIALQRYRSLFDRLLSL